MTSIAQKLIGTYVQDSHVPDTGLCAWFQKECRQGALVEAVTKFAESQKEKPDPRKVAVVRVTENCIQCSLPCRVFDHEGPSAVATEVEFTLELPSGAARRINDYA